MPRKLRPHLRLEMAELGRVDPFQLSLEERPPGSGRFQVRSRDGSGMPVERAGLCLVGASQALFKLSFQWLQDIGGTAPDTPPPVMGEMRLAVQRREARLLAALLRRHLARLPEPPGWMGDLMRALDEMDEFLRWQE
ncbi:MAG: hypothetical protein ACYTHK_13405 [Planctomycetota bacterium]|jgi:hypothetical protein